MCHRSTMFINFIYSNTLISCNYSYNSSIYSKLTKPMTFSCYSISQKNSEIYLTCSVPVKYKSNVFLSCEKHPNGATTPISGGHVNDLFDDTRDRFVHYDLGEKLDANQVLFIDAGATHSQHSGKGIAARLRTHLCNYARDTKGFKYVSVQAAHPATRRIYVKKLNGKEMTIVDPAAWLWKKKGDGLSRPLEQYKGEPIVNVLGPIEYRYGDDHKESKQLT